jgi:tetratricopeptide (TPR) repeat protein
MFCAAAGILSLGNGLVEAHSPGSDKLLGSMMQDSGNSSSGDGPLMRLEVAKPLLAAQLLLKEGKYSAALEKLREIDAIPNRRKVENDALEMMRIMAAADADQPTIAAKAYDGLVAASALSPVQRMNFSDDIAGAYFRASDYPSAIVWANRYQSEGGAESRVKSMLAQAYYFSGDFGGAARTVADLIAAEERDGQTVTENQLQILANSAIKQNDQKLAITALEKLVAAYPKAEYWSAVIRRVSAKPGFPSQLAIDVGRLRLAVGIFDTADDYMELAQQALQAGLPAEAKVVIDKGYAAGFLGSGNDAERYKRLRDMAERQTDDDLKSFRATEREADKQKTGLGLVNTGLEGVFLGRTEQGIAMIERGLAKGGLKSPEDAWLHLGEAHAFTRQTEKAIGAFRKVEGTGSATDLARLWLIDLGAKP